MLMNQCWPNPGRVSSSASWKHSGRRDAVTLAARLQNTLTYCQTILGSNLICDATNLGENRKKGNKVDMPLAGAPHSAPVSVARVYPLELA
jgi:hypothetical protein